jgi:hypothetical protein
MEVFFSGPNPYRACFEAKNNSSGKRFFINFLTLSNCDVLKDFEFILGKGGIRRFKT